jgi:hypothetical protein
VDLDEELRQLDQELGEDASSAKVVVHKVVPNGDSQRCFSCPRMQFFSDLIREQWGAGTYSIMVYAAGKIVRRARLSFAEPIAKPPTVEPGVTHPPSTYFSDSSLRDVETRFEQRLEREQARHFELLKLFAGGRPQVDPLQMQGQILSMMTTVKELTGSKTDGASSDRSAIELFLEGVKMAQKLGGGGGEGTDWGAMTLSVVEGVKAIANETRAQQPMRPALSLVPNPRPGDVPTATSLDSPEEPPMLEQLRKQLQFLVRKAAGGANPELYGEVAFDNISELPEFIQKLAIDYIRRPDCLERLIALEPAIASHREWFQKCVEEIRRQDSPQESPGALTEEGADPEGGD